MNPLSSKEVQSRTCFFSMFKYEHAGNRHTRFPLFRSHRQFSPQSLAEEPALPGPCSHLYFTYFRYQRLLRGPFCA